MIGIRSWCTSLTSYIALLMGMCTSDLRWKLIHGNSYDSLMLILIHIPVLRNSLPKKPFHLPILRNVGLSGASSGSTVILNISFTGGTLNDKKEIQSKNPWRNKKYILKVTQIVITYHGILKHATLVGGVEKICVKRVRGLWSCVNMDVVLRSICEEINAAFELLKELGISPRCDCLDCGIKSNGAHFKAHLVVTLACGTMRNIFSTFCLSDSNLCLGDKRTSDGGSKKITTLVDGVALYSGEDEIWWEKVEDL